MAVNPPTRGQRDWDDEMNNILQSLDSGVQAAVSKADVAASDAAYARNRADEVHTAVVGGTDAAVSGFINDDTSATRASLSATYARVRPLQGEALDPSGNIAWTANPTLNFAPRSIGVDGRLYFTYLNKTAGWSSDPTLAARTFGPDFTPKGTPNNILWVTRTTAGYVIITNDTPTDTAQVWFCPEAAGLSANLDDWTLVQTTKATTHIAIGKPRVINGVSWLVFGEYVTGVYPSVVRKLWLSKDGGQTWTAIRNSVLNDTTVNSHWHCAVILPSGRIWSSQGDGVNSWFGYTDDQENWIPAPLPTTDPLYDGASVYQQPTVLLDMGDVLATAPDRGTFDTGVWATDPDTGRTVEWAALPSGEVAHTQYGTGSAQRGKEAYITFPDQGSGSAKTYVFGTGDGGRSWHLVSSIDTTGGTAHGALVGPDANGKVYLQPTSGTIPTYGTGIMVGTLPVWS